MTGPRALARRVASGVTRLARRAGWAGAARGRLSLFATLRGRLVAVTVLLPVLALSISDVVMLTAVREHLVDRVDSQARQFSSLMSRLPVPLPAQASTDLGSDEVATRLVLANLDLITAFTMSYVGPDGAALATVAIPTVPGGPRLPRLDAASVQARGGRPFSVPDVDGGAGWRVLAVPYQGSALGRAKLADGTALPEGSSVVVVASEKEVDAALGRLARACLVTGTLLALALGLGGWYVVRGQLRPLQAIESTAGAIAAGDLSRRVPVVVRPVTEVGRLTDALNAMLAQLEAAFAARTRANEGMRAFVADVSHELRTPLFAIHGSTQLYELGALGDPDDLDRTMKRIRSESARLAQLATDLLLLARLDADAAELAADPEPGDRGTGDRPDGAAGAAGAAAGVSVLDPAPMDLRTLAADALLDVRSLAPDREVTLTGPDGGEPGQAPVLGDEARLRQVTANLVGNAVIHTPPGTSLRIGVGTVGEQAVWEIEDSGPGLTPAEAERVFDRFYRVDSSRSRSAGAGAGLGLAIVQALVTAHGGTVTARSTPGKGTTMRVALPRLHQDLAAE